MLSSYNIIGGSAGIIPIVHVQVSLEQPPLCVNAEEHLYRDKGFLCPHQLVVSRE